MRCEACDDKINNGDIRYYGDMKFCQPCFILDYTGDPACRCGEVEGDLKMDEFGDYECGKCLSKRIQQIMMESNGVRV